MTAAMKATATTAYHDSLPGGRLARRATTGACQSSRLSLDELVVGLNPAVGVEHYELEPDAGDLTAVVTISQRNLRTSPSRSPVSRGLNPDGLRARPTILRSSHVIRASRDLPWNGPVLRGAGIVPAPGQEHCRQRGQCGEAERPPERVAEGVGESARGGGAGGLLLEYDGEDRDAE
jgi:hypothetical protein